MFLRDLGALLGGDLDSCIFTWSIMYPAQVGFFLWFFILFFWINSFILTQWLKVDYSIGCLLVATTGFKPLAGDVFSTSENHLRSCTQRPTRVTSGNL